ncbi:MAG: ABC transporter substrate-binding protein [Chloroflexota bacterium]
MGDRSHLPTSSVTTASRSSRFRGILAATLAAGLLLAPGLVLAQTSEDAVEPGASPGVPADPVYPITFIDDEGTQIVIEARPERIVSLSPAITETVFALGAGDRLVGGTDYDDFPLEAANLPDVATFSGVILEQLVAQAPDLVLAAGNGFTPADDIVRIRELGYTVAVLYAETHEEVLSGIRRLGTAIGAVPAAYALSERIEADLARVAGAIATTQGRPRTFYQIGSDPEIYGPAPGSFLADLVELAGGTAVTTADPASYAIPLERLVAEDPEVIIVADALWGVCPADVAARPGWGSMTAVRTGAIRAVADTEITRPGPRIAQGFAELARAIHPELVIGGFPPEPVLCADRAAAPAP